MLTEVVYAVIIVYAYKRMEEMFQKLKAKQQNSVDKLTQLIKEAELDGKETEEDIKKLFADVADKSNVEFKKFLAVVDQLAKENEATLDEITKKLTDSGTHLLAAADAGIKAFKGALGMK